MTTTYARAARLGLLMAALLTWQCGGGPAEPVRIGSQAPGFELPALAGGEVSLDGYAGRPVILNFWATWCQPCRREFPVLNDLHRDPRVEVVAIALDEEGRSVVEPFVRRQGLEYQVLLGNQKVFERYSGFSIPYTLVLDRSHRVTNTYRGPAEREELERDLESMEAP